MNEIPPPDKPDPRQILERLKNITSRDQAKAKKLADMIAEYLKVKNIPIIKLWIKENFSLENPEEEGIQEEDQDLKVGGVYLWKTETKTEVRIIVVSDRELVVQCGTMNPERYSSAQLNRMGLEGFIREVEKFDQGIQTNEGMD